MYGDLFQAMRDLVRRKTPNKAVHTGSSADSLADRLQRRLAQTVIRPRWRAFIDRTLTAQPDVDAVIFLTIPLDHVGGLAAHIRDKFHKPILYYDGDVPASLPAFAGFDNGFKMYQGADVTEYDGFTSNSLGGADTLRQMSPKATHALD